MRVNRFFAATLMVGGIAGCHQSMPASDNQVDVTSISSKKGSEPVDNSKIIGLTKGMAYADLRKIALQSGWAPVVDPECRSNVMGSNHEELCKSDTSELCTVCDDLPEVSSCSGDGYCGMYFSNNGRQLHVVTFGMIEDWKVSGTTSRLSVDGWDFSKLKAGAKRN